MIEKLNHLPNEFDAAKAIIETRDLAEDSGMYDRDTYHGVRHELIGPAGNPNFYIRTDARAYGDMSAKIEGRVLHEGRQGVRHISTETNLKGPLGKIESQHVTLSKREANGKWRELTSDNPVVVRLAEVAIANQVKKHIENNAGDALRRAA